MTGPQGPAPPKDSGAPIAPDVAADLVDGFSDNPEVAKHLRETALAPPAEAAAPGRLALVEGPVTVPDADIVEVRDAGMFGYVHSVPLESPERVRERRQAIARKRRTRVMVMLAVVGAALAGALYEIPRIANHLRPAVNAPALETAQLAPSGGGAALGSQGQAAQSQASVEQAAIQQAAHAQALRAQAAREQAAREQAAREQAAREQAAREQVAREQAAREQAAREQAAREQAAKEQAAKEQAAKEQAAKEQAAKEQAAKEQAAKEQAAKAKAAKEQAAKEQAAKAKAAKEQAAKEQVAKEQAAKEQAAKEQALKNKADGGPPQKRALASVTETLQPEAIIAVSNKLSAHRTARWISGDSAYAFYVGNILNAEYFQESGTLTITSQKKGDDLSCSFSLSRPQAVSAPCSALLLELNTYLLH